MLSQPAFDNQKPHVIHGNDFRLLLLLLPQSIALREPVLPTFHQQCFIVQSACPGSGVASSRRYSTISPARHVPKLPIRAVVAKQIYAQRQRRQPRKWNKGSINIRPRSVPIYIGGKRWHWDQDHHKKKVLEIETRGKLKVVERWCREEPRADRQWGRAAIRWW